MKRFTDTDKWTRDAWFCDLEPEYKLFWLYIVDNCDNVGVWEVNMKIANMLIGRSYDKCDLINILGDKIHIFCDGSKWWIRSFIDFQHGDLSESSASKPIISYISLLKKHTLWIPYTNGTQSVQGKGQGKGKGVVKEKADTNTEAEDEFLDRFNTATGKKFRVLSDKVKGQLKARLKEGFTMDEIIGASEVCKETKHHVENPKYLTPEFITRPDKLQMYCKDVSGDSFTPFRQNGKNILGEGLCNGLTRTQFIEKFGRVA